jgi:flagellar biogenesis protein FliO
MLRLPFVPHHHDPFWDLDGAAARRSRSQRRFLNLGLALLAVLFLGFVVARLPAFDAQVLTTSGSLRPVLAIALLALLASCVLVGAARIRMTSMRS